MNISMDGQGYVHIDESYSNTNVSNVKQNMETILNSMKVYDQSILDVSMEKMRQEYAEFTNFNEMLNRWARILREMEI